MYRRTAAGLLLLALIVFLGCADIFGVETDYLDNPCLAPDADSIPPLSCGVGACSQLVPACENELPTKCPAVEPGKEQCNGLDDDCNGAVDDTCPCTGTATQSCYPGNVATRNIGACEDGVQACNGTLWGPCDGAVVPQGEECNALDDDCDGKVDEGCPCDPGVPQPCYDGPVSTRGVGACKDGTQACDGGGTLGDCLGSVTPGTETCNGVDDDCNGTVDDGCPCAPGQTQPCYTGPEGTLDVGECASGTQGCDAGAWAPCTGETLPVGELCNELDDDCDGEVDEGNPDGGADCDTGNLGACAPGILTCTSGQPVCKQTLQPSPEKCNIVDDDCDGQVDEGDPEGGLACMTGFPGGCALGTLTCLDGAVKCVPAAPAPEVCDALDNDCDGSIDDGFGLGIPCLNGIGACEKAGVIVCGANGQATCDAVPGPPSGELCDGLDNNCDGTSDEGNPGSGLACATGFAGTCATGTTQCVGGVVACLPVNGSIEVCNGVDDDCDGQIDNGLSLGTSCTVGVGACQKTGVFVCGAGGAVVCNAVPGAPSGEVCDGLDNDCDMSTDEGNPGGDAGCTTGLPGSCGAGTTVCQNGALQCVAVDVGPETCDGADNDCDGLVDDGFGIGTPCDAGVGACKTFGVFVCAANGQAVCSAVPGPASGEVCDGLDNDCDNLIDEGNPGGGGGCMTGLQGACAAGTTTCLSGALLCTATGTAPETCDGLDNDCDGSVDDGLGVGLPCSSGVGACKANGVFVCGVMGQTACNAVPGLPGAEVCDGVDNDCDMAVDENSPGSGVVCTTGLPGTCAAGLTQCQLGAIQCVPNDVVDEVCDGVDNDCDGVVDNGLGLGLPCPAGVGACQKTGVFVCGVGGAVVCNAVAGAPSGEVCDGVDNDCDMSTDEGNPGGGAGCTTGLPGSCGAGTTVCQNGALQCVAVTVGGLETCDGVDNDCDGVVDDGFGVGTPCTEGNGACKKSGVFVCAVSGQAVCNAVPGSPSGEVCDGVDNDCDNSVDEGNPGSGVGCMTGFPGACAIGVTQCQNGAIQCNAVNAGTEVCNAVDDDCDGVADNGLGLGSPCASGGIGECNKTGTLVCGPDSMVVCSVIEGLPSPEQCDGLDNDCDNSVDEGNPGSGQACMTGGQGACGSGTTQCVGGQLVCMGDPAGNEVCNGLDDNCNGVVDDPALVNGAACTTGLPGVCSAGTTTCTAGSPTCTGTVQPNQQTEICNGADDNCNGQTDEVSPNAACTLQNAGAQFVQTWACTGGACAVATCQSGHIDIDTAPSNGCECLSDTYQNQCNLAAVVNLAANGVATMTGKIESATGSDYLTFQFTVPALGMPYHPKIELVDSQGGQYAMDVLLDCNSPAGCSPDGDMVNEETGIQANIWEQDYKNYVPGAGCCSDNTPRVGSVTVRVYRKNQDQPTCSAYAVTASSL